jgi:hypothetical protein
MYVHTVEEICRMTRFPRPMGPMASAPARTVWWGSDFGGRPAIAIIYFTPKNILYRHHAWTIHGLEMVNRELTTQWQKCVLPQLYPSSCAMDNGMAVVPQVPGVRRRKVSLLGIGETTRPLPGSDQPQTRSTRAYASNTPVTMISYHPASPVTAALERAMGPQYVSSMAIMLHST